MSEAEKGDSEEIYPNNNILKRQKVKHQYLRPDVYITDNIPTRQISKATAS